jgi:D-alanyl-D-alanine carboxypeptidase (penicillin-binding protein 5/6)
VKTGFTTPAGFCVVATAERDGERLLAVVLGEPGEAFSAAATLLNYGFAAFERRSIVEAGEDLGTVEIDGREVAVEAGIALEGLVPVDAAIDRRIVVDAAVRYPPGRGQPVGTAVWSVPGRELGRAPLLVTAVPPPPPLEDDEPWWSRAIGSVLDATGGLVDALLS